MVIRFASKEEGNHLLIILRGPRDANKPLKEACDQAQLRSEPRRAKRSRLQ